MSTISVTGHFLGAVSFTRDGRQVSMPRACVSLLAYLLLHRDQAVERDRLLLLMGETTEQLARRRLNTIVWRIRCSLEADGLARDSVLVSTGHGLGVSPACELWVDALEFAAGCERLGPVEQWTDADATELARVLALYRGSFLDGVYDEWALGERGRLADLHLSGLLRLARWHQAHGHVEQALRHAQVAVSAEPLREDLHRLAIDLYHEAGLPEMARRQFDRCRELLRQQLGVEPLPETVHAAGRHRTPQPRGTPPGRDDPVASLIHDLERFREELRRMEDRMDRSVRALRAQHDGR